jgi:hypothetical protein
LPPSALLGACRLSAITDAFIASRRALFPPISSHYTLIASRCSPSPLSSMDGCCILCKLCRPPPAFVIARHAIPLLIHQYTDVRTLAQRSSRNAFLRADAVSVGLGTGMCEAVIRSATRR